MLSTPDDVLVLALQRVEERRVAREVCLVHLRPLADEEPDHVRAALPGRHRDGRAVVAVLAVHVDQLALQQRADLLLQRRRGSIYPAREPIAGGEA
eukprot:915590-Prorocentrum_minimum.AAC.1